MYVCICVCVSVYMCIRVCLYVMYIYIYVCVSVCMCVCVSLSVCVCLCVPLCRYGDCTHFNTGISLADNIIMIRLAWDLSQQYVGVTEVNRQWKSVLIDSTGHQHRRRTAGIVVSIVLH